MLDRAPVVVATLTGVDAPVLSGRRFALAAVDEATQAVEPAAILALLRADRAVLAGDHLQLPPTVISAAAAAGGLGVSLFERLADAHGEAAMVTLVEQRRMNEAIMRFPSQAMYGGRLRAHPSVAGWKLDEEPLLFVDTAGTGFEEGTPEGSDSRHNEGEAELVAREVERILALGVAPGDVAVISPYDAQVQRLRQLLATRVEEGLEVDSVDGFQGREKDAVVVSLVRSNDLGEVGFLSDVRRMNVAITRARKKLVVVGDSATVARHPSTRHSCGTRRTPARGSRRGSAGDVRGAPSFRQLPRLLGGCRRRAGRPSPRRWSSRRWRTSSEWRRVTPGQSIARTRRPVRRRRCEGRPRRLGRPGPKATRTCSPRGETPGADPRHARAWRRRGATPCVHRASARLAGPSFRQAPGVASAWGASAAATRSSPREPAPRGQRRLRRGAPTGRRHHGTSARRPGQAARRRGRPRAPAARKGVTRCADLRPGLRSSHAPPDLPADEWHRPVAGAPALVAGRRHLGRPGGARGAATSRLDGRLARGGGAGAGGARRGATRGRSRP